MRVRVREVEPHADTPDLEELVIGSAGASMPVARAVALAPGRADGRAEAIAALNAAVAGIMRARRRTRSRAVLSAGVANAAVRDDHSYVRATLATILAQNRWLK